MRDTLLREDKASNPEDCRSKCRTRSSQSSLSVGSSSSSGSSRLATSAIFSLIVDMSIARRPSPVVPQSTAVSSPRGVRGTKSPKPIVVKVIQEYHNDSSMRQPSQCEKMAPPIASHAMQAAAAATTRARWCCASTFGGSTTLTAWQNWAKLRWSPLGRKWWMMRSATRSVVCRKPMSCSAACSSHFDSAPLPSMSYFLKVAALGWVSESSITCTAEVTFAATNMDTAMVAGMATKLKAIANARPKSVRKAALP
mmetsp:Transcript_29023/g.83261  ORF Transcript_29023/g.83261 Transcript_29023/m.83261 type:complete len:254 (-) Transcript_29023:394-1155(-)